MKSLTFFGYWQVFAAPTSQTTTQDKHSGKTSFTQGSRCSGGTHAALAHHNSGAIFMLFNLRKVICLDLCSQNVNCVNNVSLGKLVLGPDIDNYAIFPVDQQCRLAITDLLDRREQCTH